MTKKEKIEKGKEIINSETYQNSVQRRKNEAASPEYEEWIYQYLEQKEKIDTDYAAAFLGGQEQYNCMLLALYSLHKISQGYEKHLVNNNWDHYYLVVPIKGQAYVIETCAGQGFSVSMVKIENSKLFGEKDE